MVVRIEGVVFHQKIVKRLLKLLLQHLLEGSSILLEALDTFSQLERRGQ
jgi:hypothetical protein